MSFYLDTSVVVSLLRRDDLSMRAMTWVETGRAPLLVSDLAAAEVAAAIGTFLRRGELRRKTALSALAAFDRFWLVSATSVSMRDADITLALSWLRRLDVVLRAPDAFHLAIALRHDVQIVTFDAGMAKAARSLALPVLVP